jgi:SAM-dependent methyltransferase
MSESVRDFYNRNAAQEWERLERPLGLIEFSSTLHLIGKYFPAPGRVCDIGGGPGRYTIELLRRGYRVTLLDLSEEEVALARTHLDRSGLTAGTLLVGDARDLSGLASASFDAALLMGPLYHIADSAGRLKALEELGRILKPEGIAILAYLNSWGIMKTLLIDAPHWYEDISVLRSMQAEHVFSAQQLTDFTGAYWSTPPAARKEIEAGGFEILAYAGAESFAGSLGEALARMVTDHPAAYINVVQVAAETCELPQYRDSTDHLHFVVRKPSSGAF